LEYIKKNNSETECLMKQAIRSLEEDKELKTNHIGQLTIEIEKLTSDLGRMGLRLDKQVEVDQEIEHELQLEILTLKSENTEQKRTIRILDEEFNFIEQQNWDLLKENKLALGTSKKLEKIVYGKNMNVTLPMNRTGNK
jgi:predicted RNase H-like nuclease (RuvC/YqgF family)